MIDLRTTIIPTKKDIIEIFENLPNHQALFFFDERVASLNWTQDELLGIYSMLECPQAQVNFSLFFKRLTELSENQEDEVVTIYRGTSLESLERYGIGHSWSFSKRTATQFAYRSVNNYQELYDAIDKTPCVLKMSINKKDIIASINNRNEEEVLIKEINQPKFVVDVVGNKREKMLQINTKNNSIIFEEFLL